MKIKTFVISILAVTLLIGIAVPSLAMADTGKNVPAKSQIKPNNDKGDRQGGPVLGKVKVIKGEVKAKAADNTSITVDATVVLVNAQTKYKAPGLGREAKLSDITIGLNVVVMGGEQNNQFTARQVVVIPGKPVTSHHVGVVTAYAAGSSITIKSKNGDNTTFAIVDAANFKILPAGANVTVGETVTIISHRDPAQNRLIASGLVVHLSGSSTPPGVKGFQAVTGNISAIDQVAKTITVGTTLLSYDGNTVIVVKGALGLQVGQQATVYYQDNNGTKLAKFVVVGINIPEALKQLAQNGREKEKD